MKVTSAFWGCLFCTLCVGIKATAQMADLTGTVLFSTSGHTEVSDTTALFTVRDIQLYGNRKTKPVIIMRELPFAVNQQMPLNQLAGLLSETRRRLMNTGLFLNVVVTLNSLQGHDAFVKIDVKERWYIYPIPFVKMVDRSFGKWMHEQDMDISRVNYGVRFRHKNTTGRNDQTYLSFINGYTKGISLEYKGLFLDKKLKWSSSMGISLGKNKEVTYETEANKQLLFKNNNFVHSYIRSYLDVSYRPAIKTTHTFGIRFSHEKFADTLHSINPDFSFDNQTITRPELYYRLYYQNVDFAPYPSQGFLADVNLVKRGFARGTNLLQLNAKTSTSRRLSDKSYANLRLTGMLKLPFRQPYINQGFIGTEDMYMQGYEYYAVDGVAGGYSKLTLARELINTHFSIPSERIKRLNYIPLRVYAKIYGNTGYVYNPRPGDNPLANRLLFSGGVGLDIVTFYDFIIKLEWSFNQLGQNGLNLHRKDYF